MTRTVHIEASRARVWKALTDPKVTVTWFSDGAEFAALELGATGSIHWDGYGRFPIEITEVVPDGSFGFRWSGIPTEQLDEYVFCQLKAGHFSAKKPASSAPFPAS